MLDSLCLLDLLAIMYVRKKTMRNKSTGKRYVYHQLVETARTNKGPRVIILVHLGTLDITDLERKIISKLVDKKAKGFVTDLKFSEKIERLTEEIYLKYLLSKKDQSTAEDPSYPEDSITFTKSCMDIGYHRSIGVELVALKFWKSLKLDNVLKKCSFTQKEIELSKIAVLGRLISPGSECHISRWYNKHSSLSEEFQAVKDKVSKDSLYRIGDKLLDNKQTIERSLRQNLKKLHSLVDKIYLYDLTNTYFESNKANSKLCKRYKSKQKRDDCPLVTLALVVDQDGFPVLSRIYKGNQSEPETLKEILFEIHGSYDDLFDMMAEPSIVMDRGIATKENIEYLKEHGYSYFVVERRNEVKDFAPQFSDLSDFESHPVSGNNYVHLKKQSQADTVKVLVYSTGKAHKEQEIMSKREKRFLEEAHRLIISNQKGNIKDVEKILVRIGRLKQKYGSTADQYTFRMNKEVSDLQKVKQIELVSTGKNPTKSELPGCYVIVTDVVHLSAKQIWDFYTKLTEVESAFRTLKSELGTRPVHHQRDDRIESHLFVSVLAYSILKSVTYTLNKKGYNKSWTSIKSILLTHMRSSVFITDVQGHRHHMRQNAIPESEVKELFKLLNIKACKNHVRYKLHL